MVTNVNIVTNISFDDVQAVTKSLDELVIVSNISFDDVQAIAKSFNELVIVIKTCH